MGPYKGDMVLNSAVPLVFLFPSYKNSTGESITVSNIAVGDIKVFKAGNSTARASTSGFTLLGTSGADFSSIVGINGFTIDISDNTTAGFYSTASEFDVVLGPFTVDAQTVYIHCGSFSIENRSALRPTTAGRTLDVASTGEAGIDFTNALTAVGPIPVLGWVENGTMQAGSTSTTAVLRSATSFANDLIIGACLTITGGTGVGQARTISDWVSSSDTATVDPAWTTTPDNTSTYVVYAVAPATETDVPSVNLIKIRGQLVPVPSVTGEITANISTSSLADVKQQISNFFSVDTFPEPGQGAPPATATLAEKIGYAYKSWRNKKTQTATATKLFADDATTVDQKLTTSDDGTTTTFGEVGSGP